MAGIADMGNEWFDEALAAGATFDEAVRIANEKMDALRASCGLVP